MIALLKIKTLIKFTIASTAVLVFVLQYKCHADELADAVLLRQFISTLVLNADKNNPNYLHKLNHSFVESQEVANLLEDSARLENAWNRAKFPPQCLPFHAMIQTRKKKLATLIRQAPATQQANQVESDPKLKKFSEDLYQHLYAVIPGLKVTQTTDVSKKLLEKIDLSKYNQNIQNFYKDVINHYFDDIHYDIKKNVIAGYLGSHPDAPEESVMVEMLLRSGPSLQKLFQLIGNKAKTQQDREYFDQLKDRIPPMDQFDLHSTLKDAELDPKVKVELKAVKSASVGEVHFAESELETKTKSPVVAKLIKKGVKSNLQHEFNFFDQITANNEPGQVIVKDLKSALALEVDFQNEANNLAMGKKVYNSKKTGAIQVVDLKGTYPAKNPVLILMEKAKGGPIFEIDDDPKSVCALGSVLSKLMKKWVRAALFESGFFHADLHGGNLFYYFDPKNPKKSVLYMLDFGNASTFTNDEQSRLLSIMLGVKFRNLSKVLDGFEYKGAKNNVQWKKFKKQVSHILSQSENQKSTKVLDEIFEKAMHMKIPLPENITNFIRGKNLLGDHLRNVSEKIAKLKQEGKKVSCDPPPSPSSIMSSVIGSNCKGTCVKLSFKSMFGSRSSESDCEVDQEFKRTSSVLEDFQAHDVEDSFSLIESTTHSIPSGTDTESHDSNDSKGRAHFGNGSPTDFSTLSEDEDD